MKSIFLWGMFATSIFLADASQAHDYLDNNAYYAWEKITVPKRQYVVRAGNDFRRIKPSCASGEPYSFHFKRGNRDKLAVYYNGGGACYDDNTCVGSLQLSPLRINLSMFNQQKLLMTQLRWAVSSL